MVFEIRQTDSFARWLIGLRDLRARIAIARRMERAAAGNLGDVQPLRDGVAEGDQSGQERDIRHAIDIAREF